VAEAVGGALWRAALRISDGASSSAFAFPGEAEVAFEASLLLVVEGDDESVSSFMDIRASDRALRFLLMPPFVLLLSFRVVVVFE
jgi:hypothetical protein